MILPFNTKATTALSSPIGLFLLSLRIKQVGTINPFPFGLIAIRPVDLAMIAI